MIDLGSALMIVPAGRGLRNMLLESIGEAGGYPQLVANVTEADADLA